MAQIYLDHFFLFSFQDPRHEHSTGQEQSATQKNYGEDGDSYRRGGLG